MKFDTELELERAVQKMNHNFGSNVHHIVKNNQKLKGFANKYVSIKCKVRKCDYCVLFDFKVDSEGNYSNLTLRRSNTQRHTADAHVREYELKCKYDETRTLACSISIDIGTTSHADAAITNASKPRTTANKPVAVTAHASAEYTFSVRLAC